MTSNDALRHYWHPVGLSSDVGDTPYATKLLDETLVIYRAGDRVVALRDLCIHRGTPLSLGWIDGENIVCAYHGWTYGPDGACLRIPSIPEERGIPRKARATAYLAQERYGLVWVCLDEPRAPVPVFPEMEDPAYHTWLSYEPQTWKANAARVVENFMDMAHIPWVHHGVIGDRTKPMVPDFDVRRDGNDLSFNNAIRTPDVGFHTSGADHVDYRVTLPFSVHFVRTVPEGGQFVISFVVSPVSAKESRLYNFKSRNYALDKPDDYFKGYSQIITEQDRVVVESQRPEELPLDLAAELHVKGPDSASVEYRRMLREIGLEGPLVA